MQPLASTTTPSSTASTTPPSPTAPTAKPPLIWMCNPGKHTRYTKYEDLPLSNAGLQKELEKSRDLTKGMLGIQ
jgi:hypothetical protein